MVDEIFCEIGLKKTHRELSTVYTDHKRTESYYIGDINCTLIIAKRNLLMFQRVS